MIYELRSYRLRPGAAPAYLGLLQQEGLPLVTRHLPLLGYWMTETGRLNTLHHLWLYRDWTHRGACRAGLAGEEAWTQGFIPRAFAMVEAQENALMGLVHGSALLDSAMQDAAREHPAGQGPLFADACAALSWHATPPEAGGAVAIWRGLSGDAGAVRLGPRSADPLPPAPADALRHEIVRPLSFSPL